MDNFSAPNSNYMDDWPDENGLADDYIANHYADIRHAIVAKPKNYVEAARRLLVARQNIAKIMPRNLFRDSAWDVMLELYIGTAEQTDVYVKQAIIASGECPATAMRIIARLEKSGFLCRVGDPSDQRRVVVSLSQAGMEAMEMLLEELDGGSLKPAVDVSPAMDDPRAD
jgi:DNA-binding MarR family transcriptional regulator